MRASDYIPGLGKTIFIHPEDIAGMVGLPYVSRVIYVDPSGGNDSNSGDTQASAVKTVATAYGLAIGGKHEVILISPTGGTGRTAEVTAITWAKRFTHLVGNAAPTMQDVRAGMSFSGTTGTATGSLTISENGCIFKNLTLTTTDDNNVFVTVSGDYNSFQGVDFKGALNGTTGDDATSRALVLSGAQENLFAACTFGADTFTRSTTNATVEFASASSRNVFDNCQFIMAADNVGPVHILFTGTSAIDRWVRFNNPIFYSFWANNADQITATMNLSAQTATGHVLVTGDAMTIGADDWEASDSGRIYFQRATATANVIGLPLNPNVS